VAQLFSLGGITRMTTKHLKEIAQALILIGVCLIIGGYILVPAPAGSLRPFRNPDGSYVRDTNGALVLDRRWLVKAEAQSAHRLLVCCSSGAVLVCVGWILYPRSQKDYDSKNAV
jgi:hypothetical protein